MTSHRIGVNLRVSGNCDQGGRKYMEDYHAIKFVKKDDRDYEFAYFGIFDGHGGPEASRFARDNLLNEITKYDQFWSDDDDDIKYAIRSGFLDTHQAMWKELDKWPRTVSGLPSTSGTTASIAIVKKSKLYIGHVGDSGIVLGCDEGPRNAIFIKPKCLTKDHKPDNPEEKARIERSGGSVVSKAGVQRVVWSRPRVNHKGPVRRSTQIDKIPFLAVARSLGDLWSYDYYKGQFVVSPDPDVSVLPLLPGQDRCLVLGSDGLWNMLTPAEAVSVVTDLEVHFEDRVVHDPMVSVSYWINPAEKLVTRALNKWRAKMMKADNISCVVVLIDPLGPSKLTVLRKRREEHFQRLQQAKEQNSTPDLPPSSPQVSKLTVRTEVSATVQPSPSVMSSGSKPNASSIDKTNHNHNNPGDSQGSGNVINSAEAIKADVKEGNCFTAIQVPSALRSSLVSAEPRPLPKTASKGSRSHHALQGAVRKPLLPRRLSHPCLTDDMDDSVQASSALVASPAFHLPLSPAPEEKACAAHLQADTTHTLAPSMPMSQSLLKLMSLDAVKASSGSQGQLKKHRRYSQGAMTRQHFSSVMPSFTPALDKTFHSTRSLRASFDSGLARDKTFHSTRVLRLTSSQRSLPGPGLEPHKSPAQARLTAADNKPFHSQPLKDCDQQQASSGASPLLKTKKRRDFGLLHRTRTTLKRARKAARKAFCPENKPFLKQLSGLKRKRDDKHLNPDTPSSKRLRCNDPLHRTL